MLPDSVECQVDLAVIGGGLSGVCAAIAAARAGARVVIMQERPVFGGAGSSEVRTPVSGAASSNAWSVEGGLIHEIMLLERATNPTGPQPTTTHLDLILDDYLERTPVEVYRSTVAHTVETGADGRLEAVVGRQLGSERTIRVRARQFIDSTGDATIAALAGARTRYGREGREEFGESLAPLVGDSSSLGSTITMQARRVAHPVPFRAPSWAIDYHGTNLTFDRTTPRVDGDVLSGFWWVEVNDPFHQIHDNQEIRRQLHRHVLGLWDYLKNHSDQRDELTHYHLEWIGQIPGKRESRRIVGDVTLTQHDVVTDPRWPDEIGAAGWWIDLHVKGGVANLDAPAERENIDRFYRGLARVAPFSVPLRACYSADVANLWVTGRCLSASHVGLGPVRVQQSLAQLGQSVGTAAAMAIATDQLPRELATTPEAVDSLQQRLLRDGVRLLHTPNRDPLDHARSAEVSGASLPLVMPTEVGDWLPIDDGLAQVLPDLGTAQDRQLSLRLRCRTADDARVRVVAERLETIWDREAIRGSGWELAEITVPSGADQWYDVTWSAPPTGTPVRIAVYPVDHAGRAEWALSRGKPPTGTLSESLIIAPGGPEPQNAHLHAFAPEEIEIPPYQLWKQHRRHTQLLQVEPPARPYSAANVTNGWAWPGRGANLWISPPDLPAQLTLAWDRPVRIGQVRLAFDTDLDTSTDARPGLHRAPECAAAFRVELRHGHQWRTAAAVTDNFYRHRVIEFTPAETTAIRITVDATHGDPSARLYEVRAYSGGSTNE